MLTTVSFLFRMRLFEMLALLVNGKIYVAGPINIWRRTEAAIRHASMLTPELDFTIEFPLLTECHM